MPKLTRSVFPVYRLMFCHFLRLINHIVLGSPGLGVKFCSPGIFKRTKVPLVQKGEVGEKEGARREGRREKKEK